MQIKCLNAFVHVPGGPELIEALLKDERLSANKLAVEGLEEMKLLLRYCDLYGILDKVIIHLRLC